MSSNTFHIRSIDDFHDAIRIIDDFSDSEVTLQEEEDDIDPDLDGDLKAYNNMQTLTSTADEKVSNEVDEDFDEDGFAASNTPRAPAHVCGRDAGHRRPRRRGGRNVRSRSPHRVRGFLWQQQINDRTCSKFAERTGPQKKYTDNASELEIFQEFFTSAAWKLLYEMTNLNAATKIANDSQNKKGHWSEECLHEMKAFFGLVITMGIIQLPAIDLY